MDSLTASAAAGLRSRIEALDLLANNLANSQTTAFKADRELYRLYETEESWDSTTGALAPNLLPDLPDRWVDLRQGLLKETGNTLDLALDGPGFFVVADRPAAGDPLTTAAKNSPLPTKVLLTRDGHFRLHPLPAAPGLPPNPARLETSDGRMVLGNNREPIVVDGRLDLQIDARGVIRQDGQERNRLFLAAPAPATSTAADSFKRAGNYFAFESPAGAGLAAAGNVTVHQGRLEAANVEPAESAVRLINVMRQFETLNRALQLGGEMNRKAVEEVARLS
ncbi:MAG: hypothetical protein K2Q23_03670 [Bryobacteraceae bacterium]|nr:hypothetical protein [Bryobacteraceae bacterium]